MKSKSALSLGLSGIILLATANIAMICGLVYLVSIIVKSVFNL